MGVKTVGPPGFFVFLRVSKNPKMKLIRSLVGGLLLLLCAQPAFPQLYRLVDTAKNSYFEFAVDNPISSPGYNSYFTATLVNFKDSTIYLGGHSLDPIVRYKDPFAGKRTFLYSLGRLPEGLEFSGMKADSISIQASTLWLNLDSVDLDFLDLFSQLDSSTLRQLIFTDTRVRNLTINNLHLLYQAEMFDNSKNSTTTIDSLVIKSCTIGNEFYFDDYPLPKYIGLKWDHFQNPQSLLDFTRFHIDSTSGICRLTIHDMKEGIKYVKLNYENFRLDFDEATTPWERESTYKELLDEQQRDGFTAGHEKLDKEYRRFEYTRDGSRFGKLQNWLDEWWWDYGYKKYRVITNSFKIFGVFVLLNILIYSWLIRVYFPEKFRALDERLTDQVAGWRWGNRLFFYLLRIPGIIVYTAFVFWGLKLDIKEMELKRPVFYLILIIEYAVGLVCLAYIANYIITK